MTETEWLSGIDPQTMLACLRGTNVHTQDFRLETRNSVVSDRKLRLVAVACCREVWDGAACEECKGKCGWWRCPGCTGEWLGDVGPDCFVCGYQKLGRVVCPTCHGTGRVGGLTDPRSRRAVEVAEKFADGEATEDERQEAYGAAADAWEDANRRGDLLVLPNLAHACLRNVEGLLHAPRTCVPPDTQAALLRDIFGNPWRVDKDQHVPHHKLIAWLSWGSGIILKFAESTSQHRCWEDLPLLGDALEEAGCQDEAILAHCRKPGLHARGCWVIDLLTGRK